MIDPRIISACAWLVLGVTLNCFVIRVWMTHPVNRVFLVGKFVTEDGLRLLLANLATVFAFGLLAIAQAGSKLSYAARWQGKHVGHYADFFGVIEAIFAVWAASCVLLTVVRLCRKG